MMGKIAELIKHTCGLAISSAGCDKAELAIKQYVDEIGQGAIKELTMLIRQDIKKGNLKDKWAHKCMIVGVKEILRRIREA